MINKIFNMDFDIAIDLTELITFGLKAYGAYLLLKSKVAKEFLSTYIGNKKLLKLEEDREILMLDNIKESIKTKALEQHKRKLKEDNAIEKTGVEKKIDEISNVITDHIIKGNEIKLLKKPVKLKFEFYYDGKQDIDNHSIIHIKVLLDVIKQYLGDDSLEFIQGYEVIGYKSTERKLIINI